MVAKLKRPENRRPWALISLVAIVATVVALGSFGGVRLARTPPRIPTAEVKRGEWVSYVPIRGEVGALKSVLLAAPSNIAPSTGGDIQLIKLARNGTRVKQGDVVVQFDVSTLQRTLDQKRSELKQAEAEIEQTHAQARLVEEQDRTDLTKASYDVERAKLEASKQEIVSRIEGEKAKINLADAEQKLREMREKVRSDQASAAADIESKKQKRDKALFEVRQAERNMVAMTLKAPLDGLVTLLPNWRAGNFGNAPEFKEGDRAWPGALIAELPDLSRVRVSGRIDEADRGRVKVGQAATVRVDAVPDKELRGQVSEISLLAKLDFSSGWPPVKNFDVAVRLEGTDPRLRPGMSATARVAAERVPDSILIPTEASFQKAGRVVAYVLRGSKFEERVLEVGRRGEKEIVVVKGLKPGERVALKDPKGQ